LSNQTQACLKIGAKYFSLLGAFVAMCLLVASWSLHDRRRVMLKVSGEALQGSAGFGIDPQVGIQAAERCMHT
jgi:hypothetical protein